MTTTKIIFQFIKAAQFFPAYAKGVADFKKKLSGKNGRGNALDFSEADKVEIRAGLKRLINEILKY